jgi:hypothetical protein
MPASGPPLQGGRVPAPPLHTHGPASTRDEADAQQHVVRRALGLDDPRPGYFPSGAFSQVIPSMTLRISFSMAFNSSGPAFA